MILVARTDLCNRVWIETEDGKRVCSFPQGENRTQGSRIARTADAMAQAFNESPRNFDKMWPNPNVGHFHTAGPTAAAGHASLLRETAGKRMGAKKRNERPDTTGTARTQGKAVS